MISINDLKIIASEIDRLYNGYSSYSSKDFDIILKENNNDPVKMIYDLLGCHLHAMPINEAEKEMSHFIFDEDLSNMPLYINESEDIPLWKNIVALWRLRTSR
jgi:hypothetical protein